MGGVNGIFLPISMDSVDFFMVNMYGKEMPVPWMLWDLNVAMSLCEVMCFLFFE